MRIRVVPRKDMTEGKRLRVSAYVRVSSESEELENSLDNQKRHYEQYIASHPGWEMGTIYADFGISGFVDARPQFQQMLEDAREKKFDLLIVKSVSRLARNTETLLRATRELKSLGIGVIFELQQINTLSGSGELMLTVRSSFSQAESEAASATSKQWIRRK
ncbi:MAG: recombinase family protein, partial [Eubacteriales bacterium]|nr:recombinase family protein [Eubacteriales bacterium]